MLTFLIVYTIQWEEKEKEVLQGICTTYDMPDTFIQQDKTKENEVKEVSLLLSPAVSLFTLQQKEKTNKSRRRSDETDAADTTALSNSYRSDIDADTDPEESITPEEDTKKKASDVTPTSRYKWVAINSQSTMEETQLRKPSIVVSSRL